MSKVIGVMGESGSGKTTAMRNLDPAITFYIDADKKGLSPLSLSSRGLLVPLHFWP